MEDLAEQIEAILRSVHRQIGNLARPAVEDSGLTWARLWVLVHVRRTPGLTMGELASRLGLTKSTVTKLVDELERDRLLVRRQDPDDRRVLRLELTDEGRSRLDAVLDDRRRIVAGALAALDPGEAAALVRSLERIEASLMSSNAPRAAGQSGTL